MPWDMGGMDGEHMGGTDDMDAPHPCKRTGNRTVGSLPVLA